MAIVGLPAGLSIRTGRRLAVARRVRVAAALSAALMLATLTGAARHATAWLEYQLRGNATAAAAFTGAHPELISNTNWPGSATK